MSAKGRIFGIMLLVIGIAIIYNAYKTNSVTQGVISVVVILMGIGKLKGY